MAFKLQLMHQHATAYIKQIKLKIDCDLKVTYDRGPGPASMTESVCCLSCRHSDLHAFLAVSGDAADEEGHATGKCDAIVPGTPDRGVAGHLAHAVLRHGVHLHNVVGAMLVTEHCIQEGVVESRKK